MYNEEALMIAAAFDPSCCLMGWLFTLCVYFGFCTLGYLAVFFILAAALWAGSSHCVFTLVLDAVVTAHCLLSARCCPCHLLAAETASGCCCSVLLLYAVQLLHGADACLLLSTLQPAALIFGAARC